MNRISSAWLVPLAVGVAIGLYLAGNWGPHAQAQAEDADDPEASEERPVHTPDLASRPAPVLDGSAEHRVEATSATTGSRGPNDLPDADPAPVPPLPHREE